MTKKLSVDDKSTIISSPSSSRELGKKYGVHHSVINDLRKEAKEVIEAHWEAKSKRRGRPKNEVPDPLVVQEKDFKHERYALETKMGWLELLLQQASEDRDHAQQLLKRVRQPIKGFERSDLKKKTSTINPHS